VGAGRAGERRAALPSACSYGGVGVPAGQGPRVSWEPPSSQALAPPKERGWGRVPRRNLGTKPRVLAPAGREETVRPNLITNQESLEKNLLIAL